MGTVVNVSAGSLLLRVPKARSRSGRAGGDSAGCCCPRAGPAPRSQSCPGGNRAVPSPTPTMQGKDAPPSLLSSQGRRRRRRDKCKNHPTALPAHCTHTANASVLFYPGLPMAPCVNTALTHTRARSGSSACKAHIWEAQRTSMHLFYAKWVLLKLEG